MKYALLGLLSMGWITTSNAQCSVTVLGAEFSSIDAAVFMAFADIYGHEVDAEYGGAIIEINGKFHYTAPVTELSEEHVNICGGLLDGWKLAALYHTHLGVPLFSKTDKFNAQKDHIPSYLGTMRPAEGRYYILSRYDPRLDVTTLLGTAERVGARLQINRYEGAPW